LLFESPNAEALYMQFSNWFNKLEHIVSRIGWDYGDAFSEMVSDLRERRGNV